MDNKTLNPDNFSSAKELPSVNLLGAEKVSHPLNTSTPYNPPPPNLPLTGFGLRPYQEAAIIGVQDALRRGRKRPLLQAPTGYGKTKLASAVVSMARRKGNRVVFVVPAISLIDQTLRMFWNDGVRDIGVIQANHIETDWSRPVQIASVQTLMRRPYPDAQLVIVDECHRWFKFYEKWMNDCPDTPFIGLSATPWTKGLGKYYDELIISATTKELISQGYLSPFRVFAPSHPDLTGVRTVAGDYHEGDLSKAIDKKELIADVVETWITKGEGRPTLCFAVDCAHAKHLQERFEQAGIACGYQDAFTESHEREEIRRKFHNGELSVVCNVGTLTTGVDWDVRCIILARPTRSEILFVQIVGRGLRTAEGKDDCLILDHSDNHTRLGFVTDIHHDSLDNGDSRKKSSKKGEEALPRECPKCAFLRAPRVAICPNCGFKPERISGTKTADGELTEITPGKKAKIPPGCVILKGELIPWEKLYFELKTYGRNKKYKPGWADMQFKKATGGWPPDHWKKFNDDIPISHPVESWIKSRMVAWAKSKFNPKNGQS